MSDNASIFAFNFHKSKYDRSIIKRLQVRKIVSRIDVIE